MNPAWEEFRRVLPHDDPRREFPDPQHLAAGFTAAVLMKPEAVAIQAGTAEGPAETDRVRGG